MIELFLFKNCYTDKYLIFQLYTYDPKTKLARQESIQVNRMLMKRYFLVQKAKDADTIGIVVGTLGVGKLQFIQKPYREFIISSSFIFEYH